MNFHRGDMLIKNTSLEEAWKSACMAIKLIVIAPYQRCQLKAEIELYVLFVSNCDIEWCFTGTAR